MAQATVGCCQRLHSLPSRGNTGNFFSASVQSRSVRPRTVQVEAKKTKKLQKIVVTDLGAQKGLGLGETGDLTEVSYGYWRNYLQPFGFAALCTQAVLDDIAMKEQNEIKAAEQVQAKAQAMATALQTIGKFIIKRKAGSGDSIFSSISADEVLQAIEQQTGRKLDKDVLELPSMKKLGTYEVAAHLHPNVTGRFKVLVQKQKEQQKAKA